MANFFIHSDGTKVMSGTDAYAIWEEIKKTPKKAQELQKKLDDHMKQLDVTWRKLEGRGFTKPEKLGLAAKAYAEAKANGTIVKVEVQNGERD